MTLISRIFMPARPLELGQIKIGFKGPKQKSAGGSDMQRPQRLNHFVVTTMEKDANDNYVKDHKIHAIVGEEPTELSGTLMYSSIEDNFHSEMCEWQGRTKKVWTCDGVTGTNLVTGESGVPCRCAAMARGLPKPCKPYMRLHLQLDATSTSLGYHVFRSGSYKTVNQIQTVIEEIFQRFGTCYGAPVKLVCFKTKDTYLQKGRTHIGQSLKVGLVLNMPFVRAREVMALYAGEAKRQPLLPVTRELNARDQQEEASIGQEFAPTEDGVDASVKTQETLDKLADELAIVEGDWEEEAPEENSDDRARAEDIFKEVLKTQNLNFIDVIKAFAEHDENVPNNFPNDWTAENFKYASEVAAAKDGVGFLVPYLVQLASALDGDLPVQVGNRVMTDGYTRKQCNDDIKSVKLALRKRNG